jgi:hypothetical protein
MYFQYGPKGLELTKVKESFKVFLMTQEHIKRVYTEEEILASSGMIIFKFYS